MDNYEDRQVCHTYGHRWHHWFLQALGVESRICTRCGMGIQVFVDGMWQDRERIYG